MSSYVELATWAAPRDAAPVLASRGGTMRRAQTSSPSPCSRASNASPHSSHAPLKRARWTLATLLACLLKLDVRSELCCCRARSTAGEAPGCTRSVGASTSSASATSWATSASTVDVLLLAGSCSCSCTDASASSRLALLIVALRQRASHPSSRCKGALSCCPHAMASPRNSQHHAASGSMAAHYSWYADASCVLCSRRRSGAKRAVAQRLQWGTKHSRRSSDSKGLLGLSGAGSG